MEPYPLEREIEVENRERGREGETSQSNTLSKTHLQFANIFSRKYPMDVAVDGHHGKLPLGQLDTTKIKDMTLCNVPFSSQYLLLLVASFLNKKPHPCRFVCCMIPWVVGGKVLD